MPHTHTYQTTSQYSNLKMAERIATKDALKKLDAQLECSICLDTFKQPKLLPCFHAFCKSPCLEKLVAKDGHSLTCPTCRHIVPLSEKGVDELQSDFHIDRLFEIRDAFNKAAEPTKTQCGNCEDDKATGYCRDCGDFLCDDCQAAHRKVKLTRNHQIATLDELKTQATNFIPPQKVIPNCPIHPENALKIYCDTCSTLICMDCTIRLHQGHNYDLLTAVFFKYKEELVSSLKPVKQKLHTVQQALKAFDTRAKEINDQRATLEAHIHKEIDQLHQLLDQRRAQLVGELDMLTQQKLKSLAAQKDQVEITQTKLTSCLEYAEGGLQTGTESEVLAMKAPVLKRIEQISAEFDPDTIQPETEADLRVAADKKGHLQQACLEFLGIGDSIAVCLENSHTTGDGLKGAKTGEQKTVVFHAMTTQNEEYKDKLNLKAELEHIKSKDRVQCEVVKQQNGQHKINYRPVKRGKHELHLTVDGNPVRGSPFPIAITPSAQSLNKPVRVVRGLDRPKGTAINSKGQMIVVEASGSCVSVLTPEGEKIRTFGTKGSGNGQLSVAVGVTVDKDGYIYVADQCNHRIQKFSPEGEFVATVGRFENNRLQFNNPLGIVYNHRDNNLYVADQSNHRIQVLTTDLRFVNTFGTQGSGNGKFQNPFGIAFDDANNLYVTDYGSDRIQVLTTEGQFLKTFSQKANGQRLNRPWAIAIDSSNTVYVSENGPDCVSVFTSQGDYITTFGGRGSEKGQFKGIYGLSINNSDSIIASDHGNGRLQIY